MPQPSPSPSPHRWNQIRQLPMHPGIRTLSQYEQAVTQGAFDALTYVRSINPCADLRPTDVQAVHFHIFRAVHPWAGSFRELGQLAVVAGHIAAESGRIIRELELAWRQCHYLLSSSPNDAIGILAALSLGHIRFERIHPFRDGNGRSGRVILAVQFERLFGCLPDFSDQRGYRDALRAASTGDLAPLMRYLGRSASLVLPPTPWPSPFRLAPRFLDGTEPPPSFADDWQWSQR